MDDITQLQLTKTHNTNIQKLTGINGLILDDIPANTTLADARTIINNNNEKLRTLITKAGQILNKINNAIDYHNERLVNRQEFEEKLNKCIDYINRHEDRQTR